MADEAAYAAVWLTEYELPGAQLLSELLQLNDETCPENLSPKSLSGVWSTSSGGRLCPLISGVALCDCASQSRRDEIINMESVAYPLMMLPFSARACLITQKAIRLAWENVLIATDGDSLSITGNRNDALLQCASDVTCTLRDMHGGHATTGQRAMISAATLSVLSGFAQRTYAPATQSSRLRGAGSGVNDND